MNGVHDLGGMHGMGPIAPEPDEPVFHREWERRAFALTLAAGFLGKWNLDLSRSAREQMPPAEYLATSYYEHWLWGLEKLLEEHGLVARAEIEARLRSGAGPQGAATRPAPAGVRRLERRDVERVLQSRAGARVDADVAPRFRPGAAVVTRVRNPVGHTRLPRYARGRRGVIHGDHGVWIFPDAHAARQGRAPQHCYSVAFEARELWGPEAARADRVYVDLFDDYLDPMSVDPA